MLKPKLYSPSRTFLVTFISAEILVLFWFQRWAVGRISRVTGVLLRKSRCTLKKRQRQSAARCRMLGQVSSDSTQTGFRHAGMPSRRRIITNSLGRKIQPSYSPSNTQFIKSEYLQTVRLPFYLVRCFSAI
jgi:hypothetical protein